MPERPPVLGPEARRELGRLAWAELAAAVRGGRSPALPSAPAEILHPRASFVSLHDGGGALRGCIGSIEPRRALAADVIANARAAALDDGRFAPVAPVELPQLQVEIAVLSPLAPLAARSRRELLAALEPGADGLLLEDGPWRATFLPVVWEQLPEPERFLAHLERKAGLQVGGWSASRRVWRYAVESFAAPGLALNA